MELPNQRTSIQLSAQILNVGHGNCSFIYDGPSGVVVDVPAVVPLLEAMDRVGASTVDHLILSHADNDHIKGAAALMAHDEVTVKALWANPDSTKLSEAFIDLLTVAADRHQRGLINVCTNLNVGANGALNCARIGVRILHPGILWAGVGPTNGKHPLGSITSNGMSAVVRIELDGSPAVLLPGDLDAKGFAEMQRVGVDMAAPVLVFPHHGGRSGAADNREFARELARAVQPELVIFSHGRSSFLNPRKEIIDGIRDALGSKVRIACTQVSRTCHASALPSSISNEQGTYSKLACAGSLSITATSRGISWSPGVSRHSATVDSLESPMCRTWEIGVDHGVLQTEKE
ncbi:ComEC/Rec2 family competence protein [Streptomyces xanthochromogenes]|uniref:ComEC/Rec2 family competence protein n=1 Tax=Streptomyces xanthochromogenes TaxID=67384 RepID=UPI0016780DFB|nr:MBL fold metallo-hydrolase [Streptomyces xanthochromogenes]